MRRLLLSVTALVLLWPAAPGAAQDAAAVLERAGTERVKGADMAAVTVLEISDLQCPFCARFATEIFPRIDSAYVRTGKVRWVYVNLPVPTHRNAWHAAEAALCAGGVAGRFWEVHDRLFATQADWSNLADPRGYFGQLIRAAGVPQGPWETCVTADQVAPLLVQDIMYARQPGVTGTPAFIVNDEKVLVGVKSFEEWKALLDAELQRRK